MGLSAFVSVQIKSERLFPDSALDPSAYQAAVLKCLKSNGRPFASSSSAGGSGNYASPEYDPFSLKMGQLTVYRFRIRCACGDSGSSLFGRGCAKMKPYEEQIWPAFMGLKGDSKENVRL